VKFKSIKKIRELPIRTNWPNQIFIFWVDFGSHLNQEILEKTIFEKSGYYWIEGIKIFGVRKTRNLWENKLYQFKFFYDAEFNLPSH